MSQPQQQSDLELNQDLGFQRMEWKVQTIGGVVMALVIGLAALGLFGTGPLSSATSGDPDGPMSIDYERFIRYGGPTTLTVQVASDQATTGEVEFWMESDYLGEFEVEGVIPNPSEVQVSDGRLIYVFAVEDLTEPFEVTFSLRPESMGRLSGEVGIPDGTEVTLSQFSYP